MSVRFLSVFTQKNNFNTKAPFIFICRNFILQKFNPNFSKVPRVGIKIGLCEIVYYKKHISKF